MNLTISSWMTSVVDRLTAVKKQGLRALFFWLDVGCRTSEVERWPQSSGFRLQAGGLNLLTAGFLAVLLTALTACQPAPQAHKFAGATMGTTYHVTVIASELPSGLSEQVQEVLDRINNLMSTYSSDSQLSQFNALQVGKSMVLAPELMEVLSISQGLYRQTEGAFEPTVGPLVDLWGFGPRYTGDVVPGVDDIEREQQRIGFHQLQLEGLKAHKSADIHIDLSAVAKVMRWIK